LIENLFNLASPKWKLQRRGDYSRLRGYSFKILAVIIALLVAAWGLEATGESALGVGKTLIDTAFTSAYGRSQLFLLATPLIFNGAAMLLAVNMKLFNLGLEGQLYMGAFAAVAVGLNVEGPTALVLVLMFLASMVAGGLYGLIPALMRVKTGVSEILTTLLLNPLAIQIAAYIGMDAWRDDSSRGGSSNATLPVPYEFPAELGDVNFGFILAAILVILIWIVTTKTTWGYEVTAGGSNIGAAKYSGMPVIKNMLIVMVLSGAIAGLSGMVHLTEVTHRFSDRISNNYGWMGINVAILAGADPLALIPWGIFLALILFSGTILKTMGIPDEVVIALTGLILMLSAVGEVLANYTLVNIKSLEKVAKEDQEDNEN
jgi:general nucleoside transport system permease protein